MQPRTCMLSALTLSSAMFLGAAALAADLPKEGTDSYTNTWMITPTGPSQIKVGDRTLGTFELNGVQHNDNGKTDMAMRCLGMYETAGTSPEQEHGACVYTDKDGDQIMTTFELKSENAGVDKLVGGTGKFAGISGTGEWTVQFPLKAEADDKLARGVVAEKIHWKLP